MTGFVYYSPEKPANVIGESGGPLNPVTNIKDAVKLAEELASMTLEEEKELVAEKLMGWKIIYLDSPTPCIDKGKTGSRTHLARWNPQSERKWWDEIWDKMDAKMFEEYFEILGEMILHAKKKNTPKHILEDIILRGFHTAKPEVCWEALIKTLEEQ